MTIYSSTLVYERHLIYDFGEDGCVLCLYGKKVVVMFVTGCGV